MDLYQLNKYLLLRYGVSRKAGNNALNVAYLGMIRNGLSRYDQETIDGFVKLLRACGFIPHAEKIIRRFQEEDGVFKRIGDAYFYEATPGEMIETAISKAIEFVNKKKVAVHVRHNHILLAVNPSEEIEEIFQRWNNYFDADIAYW